MDEETKENIFITEFSTKFDEETGNLQRGLGLTLVKDFVEQDYHGSIEVETAPGEGTTFSLRIPMSEIAEET
jgi:two-component system sensor histidine kinase YcbA